MKIKLTVIVDADLNSVRDSFSLPRGEDVREIIADTVRATLESCMPDDLPAEIAEVRAGR